MRTPVSRPDKDVENFSRGSGPVIPSQLTQEELEAIRLKYPAPAPNKKQTKPYNLPTREREEMALELTKEKYLQERLSGKTRDQIAKEKKVQLANLIGYHLKKWGLKDESVEELALEALKSVEAVSYDEPEIIESDEEHELPSNLEDPPVNNVQVETVVKELRFITIAIPIIDGVWDRYEQRLKVQEEINEAVTELESNQIDHKLATAELLDLIQAYSGLIRAEIKGLLVEQDADDHLTRFFQHLNQQHIAKIERYAAERGWVLQCAL